MWAVTGDKPQMVKLLIDARADVEISNKVRMGLVLHIGPMPTDLPRLPFTHVRVR